MTDKEEPAFADYQPAHRERLQGLAQRSQWKSLLGRRTALEQWRRDTRIPPAAPAQQIRANEYLREHNTERVRRLLDGGVTDEKVLLEALGNWKTALLGDDPFPVVFLGLVLTLDCSFTNRCVYCNQIRVPERLGLDDWKALLEEVAEPVPPYVYITGGEPLMLAAEVWGDTGLVAFATQLGCAVNINTNGTLIKPHIALQLVKVGLAKLHISLDCADPDLQDELFQLSGRTNEVLDGILNIQIAREVLGTNHPEIHVNCVLTQRNLFGFPGMLRFLLGMRRPRPMGIEGKGSLSRDLSFHLIPVGGSENALLRPTAEEWKRFYTETWAEAEEVWQAHQEDAAVPEGQRKSLAEHFPFANPFLRVDHRTGLDEYCERAARGQYWRGALTDRCYVAPTQAFVLPDGSQHWCGAHAICRPPALGNVLEGKLRDNIRSNIPGLTQYPNDFCAGCAGATCVINQAAERNLRNQIKEWLQEREALKATHRRGHPASRALKSIPRKKS